MHREERKYYAAKTAGHEAYHTKISLSEIHKMIPHLLLKYRLELRAPGVPLTKHDFWFHNQKDFIVRVHERSD